MKEQTIEKITDFMGIISSIQSNIFQIIPNLVSGLLILLLGIAFAYFAKWIGKFFVQGIAYLIPSKVREKSFIKENLKSTAEGFGKILFFITLFLFLISSLQELRLTVLSNWLIGIGRSLPNLVLAIFIIFLGWKVRDLIRNWVNLGLEKAHISFSRTIGSIVSWMFFICNCYSIDPWVS